MLTITIAISTTRDTCAAIGCTEWCRTTTACIVRRITDEAGLVDALASPWVTTVEVSLAANTGKHAIIIGTDGGIPIAALIRAHDAELTLTADAFASAGVITVIAVETRDTLAAICTRATEWRRTTTARIIRLITGSAATGHTLAEAWLVTVGIDRTTNAGKPIGPVDAQRGIPVTAGVGVDITGDTGVVYALVAITVTIAATLDTPAAIAQTEGRIDPTARVICWITGRTLLVDALLAITIGITATAHTAAAIG